MPPTEQAWTRAHDALIAERAEGLKVFRDEIDYWAYYENECKPVPHYLADLAAIARAQEAWRLQEPKTRRYRVEVSKQGGWCEVSKDWTNAKWGEAETESAARAWATWRACGGAE